MVGVPTAQEKAESPLGLYLHVPFCATTCDFCAFYQTVPQGDAIAAYLRTVAAEADLVTWDRPVSTVFWGGGTPGLLSPSALEALGEVVRRNSGGLPLEWTVELAPATVTSDRLAVLKAIGVTRVSLGVQSFQPALLEALGRQHTLSQIRRAHELIRAAGFASVNLDLMFALPNQDEAMWQADLAEATRLAPDHLSTYCLTFEEDTALWVKLSRGQVKRDAGREADYYQRTWEFLAAAGYPQYEVSNFARPGHVCLHNRNTWHMHEWVGLGPSAASQHAGARGSNPADLQRWQSDVEAGRRATSDVVALTPELLATDSVVFGLRMNEGVSLPQLRQRFPTPRWEGLFDLMPALICEGLLVSSPEGRIGLTDRGRLLADAVGSEIMAAFSSQTVSP
jgi:oxygen-independent coproporphyrinogen-3 oxidase